MGVGEQGVLAPIAADRRPHHTPNGAGSVLDDIASATLHQALDSLATRQRVIADNIANVQTPGFQAQRVMFEDALRQAVVAGAPQSSRTAVAFSLEPTRLDGNNVNMDHETLSNIDTGLRYELMLRAMDNKYGLLRDVISGGG
jgi:flagellar basal-body rod protein FlgB